MKKVKRHGGTLLATKASNAASGSSEDKPKKKKVKKMKKRHSESGNQGTPESMARQLDDDFDEEETETTTDGDDEDHQEVDDDFAEFAKSNTRTGGMSKHWSDEEKKYVVRGCLALWDKDGPVPLDVLDTIAAKINARFHEGQELRNGESMWWFIHREQKKGNLPEITISGGAPKRNRPSQSKKPGAQAMGPRTKHNQAIHNAMKQPMLPPPATPRIVKASAPLVSKKPAGGGIKLTIIIKNEATGEIQKVSTGKFSSVDDVLFAVS